MEEDRERAFRIVYGEAIHALDLQRAGIDSLRATVGFLVSAAAVSTSFLGGLALTDGNGDAGSWLAIALFVAFGIASLRVLWPRAEGAEGFSARPSLIIREYLEPTDGTTASDPWVLYRELSLFSERKHEYNRRHHHQPLSAYFRAAVLLLTAEIAAWIVDLALR